MRYYDKIVENPDAALDDIAAGRGFTREQMAGRLAAIRAAAGDGAHLTISQAQQFFDEADPPVDFIRAHLDGCAYCQALVDGLHPTAIGKAVSRAGDALFESRPKLPAAAARAAPAAMVEGMRALCVSLAVVILLVSGAFLRPMFWPEQDSTGLLMTTSEAYEGVRAAFVGGDPAVGYERLTLVFKKSGLDDESVNAVSLLENVVEEPIDKEVVEKVLAVLLDGGKPIHVEKIQGAAGAQRAMMGFARIGDHPRALGALRVYLEKSEAPAALLTDYSANLDPLAVAAAKSSISRKILYAPAGGAKVE